MSNEKIKISGDTVHLKDFNKAGVVIGVGLNLQRSQAILVEDKDGEKNWCASEKAYLRRSVKAPTKDMVRLLLNGEEEHP